MAAVKVVLRNEINCVENDTVITILFVIHVQMTNSLTIRGMFLDMTTDAPARAMW